MRDVFACYLHPGGEVQHSFLVSLAGLMAQDQRIVEGGPVRCKAGTGGIAAGRNNLTRTWLDKSDADWMWTVDTDMGFAPDTLDRLLAAADPVTHPVVGALCFAWWTDDPDGMGGYRGYPRPTLYGWDGNGFKAAEDYPRDRLVSAAATGAACLLVHRTAAEKVRSEHGDDWWTPVRYPDGQLLGEDLSFCYRLGEQQIPLHVDTRVKTTHAKTIWVGEADWLAWREAR